MFVKPIYELLAIAATSASLLLMWFLASAFSLVMGSLVIIASGVVLYRHYMDMGTDADEVLELDASLCTTRIR